MRINTSQISMDASTDHKDVTGRVEQINSTRGDGKPQFQLKLPGDSEFSIQRSAENRQSQSLCATSTVSCAGEEKRYQLEADQVMERMVQRITGQRVRLRRLDGLGQGGRIMISEPVNPPGNPVPFTFTSHSLQSLQYEYERVAVSSSGTVQLSDGRSISFSMDLSMERESLVRESVAWQAAANVLMDPLVLNFDCDLRGLANQRFEFDLDCDGQEDDICSLRPGSGFLALDLNNDLQINNGSELFGPETGYGFAELAVHDQDQNGWIDENDPVFTQLRIWKPGSGEMLDLLTLKEAGVGAICLTNAASSFQLRDNNNQSMGEVAATGVFLTESGEVRPVQEILISKNGNEDAGSESLSGGTVSESRFLIQEMIALRKAEVQTFAQIRRARQADAREHELFARLFPTNRQEEKNVLLS